MKKWKRFLKNFENTLADEVARKADLKLLER